MAEPTKPGQKCRVIGSASGTSGHSVGKEVVTVFQHDQNPVSYTHLTLPTKA